MVLETGLLTLPGLGFASGRWRAPDRDHLFCCLDHAGICIPDEFDVVSDSADISAAKGEKRRGVSLDRDFRQSVVVWAHKACIRELDNGMV